jgi:fengycin family lipopeptide synthetase D
MLHFYQQLYGVGEGTAMSQVANISFDASAFEIWPALSFGGCLHIAPRAIRPDAEQMREWLISQEIEVSFQPPAIAEQLVRTPWGNKGVSLKVLNVAGDRFHYSGDGELPFKVYNLYGPTEDTIWTTWKEIKGEDLQGSYSIGRPIANKRILILDGQGKLQPVGVPGELHIVGEGLALGYINNPALTEEKFVACPYYPGQRMYRTGDLARWREDGQIEFLGRRDEQVKIRGIRIEPGEIVGQLVQHAEIREAVVVVRERNGDKYLAAYYVPEGDREVEGIRGYLSERLPEYMVPSSYTRLEKIPLTANGKLDKKALPAPELEAGAMREIIRQGTEEILTDVQEKLAGIWSEVLGIETDQLSLHSNFFELGGHSLKAAILVNKINKKMGAEMLLKEIFEKPTIEQQAGFINMNQWLQNSNSPGSSEKIEVVI